MPLIPATGRQRQTSSVSSQLTWSTRVNSKTARRNLVSERKGKMKERMKEGRKRKAKEKDCFTPRSSPKKSNFSGRKHSRRNIHLDFSLLLVLKDTNLTNLHKPVARKRNEFDSWCLKSQSPHLSV